MIMRLAVLASVVALGVACGDANERRTGEQSATPAERDQARNDVRPGEAVPEAAQPADRDVTRAIREQLTADQSLSTSARNVTISAENGIVTLKGQVQNEQEKDRIEQIAQQTAGVQKVENDLEVAS